MNKSVHTSLFTSLFALSATVGALGCDVSEPDSPVERDAVLVLEIDGESVEVVDVAEPEAVEEHLLDLAAEHPAPVCGADEQPMDLVLEIDGDPAASVHQCAQGSSPAVGPDAFTAEPDAQGSFWCVYCDQTLDCFGCCMCNIGNVGACAAAC
ncbi:MAG: hypothetical protein AAGF11_33535 [Myxococcota bacterium]